MPTKNWTRIIVALFASIMICISLITGDSIDENGTRWISGVSGAVILLLLIYDRWAWRWPILRKIAEYSGRPVIRGTWKGTLEYVSNEDAQPGSTNFYLSIYQTYSSLTVRGFLTRPSHTHLPQTSITHYQTKHV